MHSIYQPSIGDIISHPSLGYEDPIRYKKLLRTNLSEATQMGYEDPLGIKQAPENWCLLNTVGDIFIFAPCFIMFPGHPEERLSEILDFTLLRLLDLPHHETRTEKGLLVAIVGSHCVLRTKEDLGSRGSFDRISVEDTRLARPKIKDTGQQNVGTIQTL